MHCARYRQRPVFERCIDRHPAVIIDAPRGEDFFRDIAFKIFTIHIGRSQYDIRNIARVCVNRRAVNIFNRRNNKPCTKRMGDKNDFLDPFRSRQFGQEIAEIALVPIHVGFIHGIAQQIAL